MIDATVGGPLANSYSLVAEADSYFDERLGVSSWSAAIADDKARALIMATRRIDLEEFEGSRVSEEQALKWPRFGADDADGWWIEQDEIPIQVKQASFEMALALLEDPEGLEDTGLEAFERVKVGPIEVEPRHLEQADELPDIVRRLLAPFLLVSGASIRLIRG